MIDNELNSLVAEKVMGREVYRGPVPYDNLTLIVPNSWGGVPGYGMQPTLENCPDYANDIAAAWQGVERVGAGWIIYNNRGVVEIYDSIYNFDEGRAIESDTSPSRAICLAALKAVGVEVE